MDSRHTFVRKNACVALVEIETPARDVLRDCFREFGIDTLPLRREEIERLQTSRFAGCVVRLDGEAGPVLELARSGAANFQMFIYGVAANSDQALPFAGYGINALIDDPVEKKSARHVVRKTYRFVVREVRRYVRVPLVTTVTLHAGDRQHIALGESISCGGISVNLGYDLPIGLLVETEFILPHAGPVRIPASVRWASEGRVGLCFDANAAARPLLKTWTERFVSITDY
jgi:hypothetical protein